MTRKAQIMTEAPQGMATRRARMTQVEIKQSEWSPVLKREISYLRARMATNHGSLPTMPISLFGNVALPRSRCPDCKRMSILIAGRFDAFISLCCEVPTRAPVKVKRECVAAHARRRPPLSFRREQLALQSDCCFWCDRPFRSSVRERGDWDSNIEVKP